MTGLYALHVYFNLWNFHIVNTFQGIPEHLTQERPAQSSAAHPAAQSAQPAARPAPATAPTVGGSASGEGTEPENINLFEAAAAAASQRGSAPSQGRAGAASLGNLDFLRNNPQFQQLRQVVQQQPQMLEPILQQVGIGNPQLAALISQNPEAFLQLLSEDAGDDEGGPLPPGSNQIAVTPEERDAIERVSLFLFLYILILRSRSTVANGDPSYVVLVLTEIWSFKRTLPATKMKSSQPTFCSNSPTTTWKVKSISPFFPFIPRFYRIP